MLKKRFMGTKAKRTAFFTAAFMLACAVAGVGLRSGGPIAAGQAEPPSLHPVEGPLAEVRPYEQGNFPQNGEYPAPGEEPVFSRETAAPAPAAPAILQTGFVYSDEIPLSYELQDYTYRRCTDRKLEYELILALMWRESGFTPDAVGYNDNGTKDNGIMQINDVNRGWLEEEHGITDLMNPYQNIDAGTLILSGYAEKYGIVAALMAYQYGEEGMKQKHAEGVYTNDLIAKLMTKREELIQILA